MVKLLCFAVAICAVWLQADAAKILGILPFGSKSHFAIGNSIMMNLHKAGHDITVISPFPQKKALERHRDISIKSIMDQHEKDNGDMNAFEFSKMPTVAMVGFLYKMGYDLVDSVLVHEGVKELMDSKEKFDVCVLETFNIDALTGLADHFDCVLISFATFGAVKWVNEMTGNQSPGSYVPHPFLRYTDVMTFGERLHSTAMTLFENAAFSLVHMPLQRRLYNKHFPNAKKSYDEMFKSSAIIFMNNHIASSSARPYLPNMIEIAGVHVGSPKALPEDIQKFLDSAKNGAVLFSMGSVVRSTDWPEQKREAFVKAFAKLNVKVLWKYENDTLPNKPDNVMISPWIPQRDILAHPNIKVFMTHGGLLGTSEAMIEGVPLLGFPVFGDQMMNMEKAVTRGYGLKLSLDGVTEESVSKALNSLLTDKRFKEQAELISSRFNDRPMSPQDAVVYWTEYALRHKGAPHLRAAGNDLSFFAFHLIDVYLTLAMISFVSLYISYLFLRFIVRKIFGKSKNDKKLKKK